MGNAKKKIALVSILMLVVVIVAIIPVIIVFSTKSDEILTTIIQSVTPTTTPKVTKLPYDPSKLTDEEKSRINCFLEEQSRFENLTKYQCEEVRSCIYDPSNYDKVPTCYFDREKLGYSLEDQEDEDDKEVYHLKKDKAVKAPYLGAIEELTLTVEYLGENIIRVKVNYL